MGNHDELLTCSQVATLKKVNLRSVYRAIKEGRLAARKMGDIYVVTRGAAEKWRARSGRYGPEEDG